MDVMRLWAVCGLLMRMVFVACVGCRFKEIQGDLGCLDLSLFEQVSSELLANRAFVTKWNRQSIHSTLFSFEVRFDR